MEETPPDAPSDLSFRMASLADLETLVRMLAEDPLGELREDYRTPLPEAYLEAFAAIDADPRNLLIVGVVAQQIAGFLQLTIVPYLTYQGRSRAIIEGVRVDAALRGRGIGRQLIEHAIAVAREHRCHVVQLTTDKARPRALTFYESLGFRASHEGMKLHLG